MPDGGVNVPTVSPARDVRFSMRRASRC